MANATAKPTTATTRGARGRSGQAVRERLAGVETVPVETVPVADPIVGERELTSASYGKRHTVTAVPRTRGDRSRSTLRSTRRLHGPDARLLPSSGKLLRARWPPDPDGSGIGPDRNESERHTVLEPGEQGPSGRPGSRPGSR